jgi:AcrR family transcriptional regulator
MSTRRTRRTPEDARRRILEAAEKRLAAGGPEAVRIQHVAADLGLTDAAIYHHFGNREGLMDALSRFGARRLRTATEEMVAGWGDGEPDIEALVELAVDTFERRGYSNLILWLSAQGLSSDRGAGMFDAIARTFEARATEQASTTNRKRVGGESIRAGSTVLEPRFLAALLVMVCAAEPVLGSVARRSVGLGGGRPTALRFRAWFAALLAKNLHASI